MSAPPGKLLLIGPWPPPHGGISVHLEAAYRQASQSGAECRVLDTAVRPGRGPRSRWHRLLRLLSAVRRRAHEGWVPHLHTTGHSDRSWLLALLCGLAAGRAAERRITLHSGMAPGYLTSGGRRRRLLARLALAHYDRVICVSPPIRDAVAPLGTGVERLEMTPAYLGIEPARADLPPHWQAWLRAHRPLLTTTLFHRPEYGLETLLAALASLKTRYPELGCIVLGGGDGEAASRQTVAARGMDGWTEIAGDLPHALCLALIARCDLLVRATLADGDSLSVREALALGVPVVATDVSPRPPGTRLFRAEDPVDLAACIATTLSEGRRGEASC